MQTSTQPAQPHVMFDNEIYGNTKTKTVLQAILPELSNITPVRIQL